MNAQYFELHARKFYEAAKLGNYELAEWEAQLLVQPFIKEDEAKAVNTPGIFGAPDSRPAMPQTHAVAYRKLRNLEGNNSASRPQRSGFPNSWRSSSNQPGGHMRTQNSTFYPPKLYQRGQPDAHIGGQPAAQSTSVK